MLTIHREESKPRLVTMGQADKVIEETPPITDLERTAGSVAIEFTASQREQPPEQVKVTRGRPKNMAKDKDSSKAGVDTIREDKPGEQGAIGTHGENAPAQTKVPQSEDDKGEGKANG